ncbi:acyltransferase [Actinoplanes sp. NPDC051346]|uniref:acyltransferase family protein n=1 Tax=Actinoplanes sp. NPDC051346 TaxID=3155048 RepID=UPI003414FDDB
MPATRERQPGRLAVLDGLRLLAALMVVACHYVWESFDGVHPPQYTLPTATRIGYYGFLGVELFFLISGFVICMSSWGRGLGDFCVSRISRLFPAFWFAVVATAAVITLTGVPSGTSEKHEPGFVDVLVNLTMLNYPSKVPSVDAVYWTLFSELRFYLLFAVAVVWAGVTYRRALFFCLGWLAVTVLSPMLGSQMVNLIANPRFSPYFIAGIAMFLMHRFGPNLVLWGIVALSWVLSMNGLNARIKGHHVGFPVSIWPARVIVTVAFAVILVVALGYTDRIRWKWLTVAGALTYPLYLLHQRIGTSILRKGYDAGFALWWLIPATAVAMMVAAYLVHRFVERPLSRRLRDGLRSALADIRQASARDTARTDTHAPGSPGLPHPRTPSEDGVADEARRAAWTTAAGRS